MTRRPWTADELRVLDARFPHERTDDLARELGRPLRAVYQKAYTRGLHKSAAYLAGESASQSADGRGVSTRFAKGHATWNKGMRYEAGGRSIETRFRPGHVSARWHPDDYPIGALRIRGDGELCIKIAAGCWVRLQRYVWATERGAIPRGMSVVSLNGDPHDARIENLVLMSRADLMRRNTVHNYPPEIARAVQLVAALRRQINQRTTNGQDNRDTA